MYGQIGLDNPMGYMVRDLWSKQDIGLKYPTDTFITIIPPTGVVMIKATLAQMFATEIHTNWLIRWKVFLRIQSIVHHRLIHLIHLLARFTLKTIAGQHLEESAWLFVAMTTDNQSSSLFYPLYFVKLKNTVFHRTVFFRFGTSRFMSAIAGRLSIISH